MFKLFSFLFQTKSTPMKTSLWIIEHPVYFSINQHTSASKLILMRSVDNHLPFRNNSMNVLVVFIQFNLEMLLFAQDWNKNSCTKAVKKFVFLLFSSSIDLDIYLYQILCRVNVHAYKKKKKKMPSISFSKSHFRKSRSAGCKKFIMWNVKTWKRIAIVIAIVND